MFEKAGFDVVDTKLDLSVVDMRKALREFGTKARDADVAVIYYAGHGIELDGNNYLSHRCGAGDRHRRIRRDVPARPGVVCDRAGQAAPARDPGRLP